MKTQRELMNILIDNIDPSKAEGLVKKFFTEELISNLLCNAFEMGGISYWVESVSSNRKEVSAPYTWATPLKENGYLILKHDPNQTGEEDDLEELKITRESINKGLILWVKDNNYNHHVVDALTENDDVITGDVFYQFISMGKVIYG